jgi:hypothetical protein
MRQISTLFVLTAVGLITLVNDVCATPASVAAVRGDGESARLHKVILGLFRNENGSRVRLTLHDREGIYAKIEIAAHGVDRTAVWPGTVVVQVLTAQRTKKDNRITAEQLHRYAGDNQRIVYYSISGATLSLVPFREGRKWDR